MPELPEVQTVVQTLRKLILNKKIINVIVLWPKILKNTNISQFKKQIIGQQFTRVERRGKTIVLFTNKYILLSHLRMEGKYYFITENSIKDEHNKNHYMIHFIFEDKSELIYHDTRRFGTFHIYNKNDFCNNIVSTPLNKLGYEPWNTNLTSTYLFSKIKNRNVAIKTLLLNQEIIAGIGNIYADEILYCCKLFPSKKGNQITKNDCKNIIKYTKIILKQAINCGGTTVSSFSHGNGIDGKFQNYLNVYGKKGSPCKICKSPILKCKINGRGTHWCKKCQKE